MSILHSAVLDSAEAKGTYSTAMHSCTLALSAQMQCVMRSDAQQHQWTALQIDTTMSQHIQQELATKTILCKYCNFGASNKLKHH
eukprot:8911-Heterococcus_DN1.PRE.1